MKPSLRSEEDTDWLRSDAVRTNALDYDFDPAEHPRAPDGKFIEVPSNISWLDTEDMDTHDYQVGQRVVITPGDDLPSRSDGEPQPALVTEVSAGKVGVRTAESYHEAESEKNYWDIVAISEESVADTHPRGEYNRIIENHVDTDWEPIEGVPGGAIAWRSPDSDEVVYRRDPPGVYEDGQLTPVFMTDLVGDTSEPEILIQTSEETIAGTFKGTQRVDEGSTRVLIETADGEERAIPQGSLQTTPGGTRATVLGEYDSQSVLPPYHPRPAPASDNVQQFQGGGQRPIDPFAEDAVNVDELDDEQQIALERTLPEFHDRYGTTVHRITTDPEGHSVMGTPRAHFWQNDEGTDSELYFNPDKFTEYDSAAHVGDGKRDTSLHEAMHAYHYEQFDDASEEMNFRMTDQEELLIADAVSEYATMTPMETIAEIGLKLLKGETVNEHARRLYAAYGGPDL